MSVIRSKLAIFSKDRSRFSHFAEHEPLWLTSGDLQTNQYNVEILLLDGSEQSDFSFAKSREFSRILYVLGDDTQVNLQHFPAFKFDRFIYQKELTAESLNDIWQELRQKDQDETYLSLSTELNQQYEILKNELEKRLSEKSRNLIESRKQIFEINNRVEILRKSLYATTEVKSLNDAESTLNDLLVSFNMITWLKIIKEVDSQRFENDLTAQFDSTFYFTPMTINGEALRIYFFKGDKRPFRKQDLNYFVKLNEALQINLNRYNNLLELQQNERLFDLAFHSSPHPIIIIDKDYHIYQANLAAEKNAADAKENLKCYELLFDRNKPCVGCQLGSKFEIQKNFNTYAVQSNRFSNSQDSENAYWIHLYEDISEQKALEGKYQQAAKLSEVGLISSSIAHELNNPLGGIISYLQIMKMEIPNEHPFQEDIKFLTEASLRMKKHIEDLLFFSRKEDQVKLEKADLFEVLQKNLDLLQMQLKKEHLIVSFVNDEQTLFHDISILHFRNIIHLVFQFFQHKLKIKKQNKANFSGLVEVKLSQDQTGTYLSFNSNLGPHDIKLNSNDLSLITLEKSILDQGFQLVISEPQPMWLQLLIKLPLKK